MSEQPIYIIKKKVHGHGHHGGAWKVAYADFVTAMMAFFMVMWLMGSSDKVKSAVSGYFRDPQGFKKQSGTGTTGEGEQITVSMDNMDALKEKIQSAMKQLPDFKLIRDHVSMTVTGEGLRIELMEKEGGMFFQSGSPSPSDFGRELLVKMSGELAKLPNNIVIEGHTDAKPFSNDRSYSNWELSSDRANSARRLMRDSGLRPDQIKQVRGFADQRLMDPKDPAAPKNRRISVIVQYTAPIAGPEDDPAKDPAKDAGKDTGKDTAKADSKHQAGHDAKADTHAVPKPQAAQH